MHIDRHLCLDTSRKARTTYNLERREYYTEQQIHLGKDKALSNLLGYSLHIQNSSIIAYHQPELHKTARNLPIKEVPRWVYSIAVIFYNGHNSTFISVRSNTRKYCIDKYFLRKILNILKLIIVVKTCILENAAMSMPLICDHRRY